MSTRLEANAVRALELVNLDSTTKAARLYDAAGNSLLIGIVGGEGSTVVFVSRDSEVYVGYLYMNPGLYEADGKRLYDHALGSPLHEAIELLVGIKSYRLCDQSLLPPKLAYFTDLEAEPSSLRFRLVIRVPNFCDLTQERFLEADVVFHKLPVVLTKLVAEAPVE